LKNKRKLIEEPVHGVAKEKLWLRTIFGHYITLVNAEGEAMGRDDHRKWTDLLYCEWLRELGR